MNDSVARKHAKLVDRLYDKTIDGEPGWQLGPSRMPELAVGNYKVRLHELTRTGVSTEYVVLLNEYDEEIESFSDEDLTDYTPNIQGFEDYWPMLTRLREAAFRQAVGAARALDDILKELDTDF